MTAADSSSGGAPTFLLFDAIPVRAKFFPVFAFSHIAVCRDVRVTTEVSGWLSHKKHTKDPEMIAVLFLDKGTDSE